MEIQRETFKPDYQGKRTEELVCRLMRSAPSTGSLPSRLEVFSRQLMLQSTAYSPMGMCTLDRPLVASVSNLFYHFIYHGKVYFNSFSKHCLQGSLVAHTLFKNETIDTALRVYSQSRLIFIRTTPIFE